jgi:hypothetical protein
MDFFSDTQETASRFADYVEDLQDVFRCHGVDFGSPEDFFAFARTVRYHSELRGDVLRVVKSVMESETNVSFRTILTVIAVASGSPDVATSDREMSIPVKMVIESLIGVGACRQLNADHPDGLYSDLTVTETARAVEPDNLSSLGGEAIARTEVKEPSPIVALDGSPSDEAVVTGYIDEQGHTDAERIVFEETHDSSIDQMLPSSPGPSNGSGGPLNDDSGSNTLGGSTLAESLTRLELNSLQLKIYLDSIDQRISRMEPRLENVSPIAQSTPPLHTREEGAARYSAIVPAALAPAETVPAEMVVAETVPVANLSAATISAATEPELPQNDPHLLKDEDRAANAGRAATGPTVVLARLRTGSQEFYSSRRQGVLPVLVGVATVLVAASLFWSFGRHRGYAGVNPVNASAVGAANTGGVSAGPDAASSVGDPRLGVASVSDPSAAPGVGGPGKGSQGNNSPRAYNYTRQGVSRSADAPAPPSRTPGQNSLSSPSSSPSSESPAADDTKSSREMATDTSEIDAPAVRTYKLSSEPSSNRLVNVSSGVMAANLLSGPKPSYPTLASLTHTQGNVVMQAVISKIGTVEHLRVIKGHRLLRGAAKSAVQNWRYRPYKVGGVPVEVATIVSVDFSLHR